MMTERELTWNQAIEQVLGQSGEPMHYLLITEAILEHGLRTTPGATPSYTVAANLALNINGPPDQVKFVRVSRGVYGLKSWQVEGDTSAVTQEEQEQPDIEPGIQAYGIYWDRDNINWLKSSVRLYGQQFQKAASVDFGEQRGLYILYDHRTIVYIGRATKDSIGQRLRDHTLDRLRSRWDRFSWFGFWGVKDDGSLVEQWEVQFDLETMISQLEATFIEATEPAQNRQQGKGLVGIEYLQVEDPSFKEQRMTALKSLVDRR